MWENQLLTTCAELRAAYKLIFKREVEQGGTEPYPTAAFETVLENIHKHTGIIYNVRKANAPPAKVDGTGGETCTYLLFDISVLFFLLKRKRRSKVSCFFPFYLPYLIYFLLETVTSNCTTTDSSSIPSLTALWRLEVHFLLPFSLSQTFAGCVVR